MKLKTIPVKKTSRFVDLWAKAVSLLYESEGRTARYRRVCRWGFNRWRSRRAIAAVDKFEKDRQLVILNKKRNESTTKEKAKEIFT